VILLEYFVEIVCGSHLLEITSIVAPFPEDTSDLDLLPTLSPNRPQQHPTQTDTSGQEFSEIPLQQGILRQEPAPGYPLASLEQRIRLTGQPKPSGP
jgi:hypothetical protein